MAARTTSELRGRALPGSPGGDARPALDGAAGATGIAAAGGGSAIACPMRALASSLKGGVSASCASGAGVDLDPAAFAALLVAFKSGLTASILALFTTGDAGVGGETSASALLLLLGGALPAEGAASGVSSADAD